MFKINYLRADPNDRQAVQLFDSWAGSLSPHDYTAYVLPYTKAIIDQVKAAHDVPFIHFGTGTSGFLHVFAQAGVDVVGVDWRIDLARAWDGLGDGVAVQGNLDPVLLLGPVEQVKSQADRILQSVAGRNGHIFNLGHGVLKETPVANVAALVDHVHAHSQRTVNAA
ncbi:MAG: hypothetical protein O3A51_12435 [Verrucomicrobia bacterium]|nr:hypothetical protein [Verrucomicrobiota bacterium]